jgi:hypothetical protein
MTAALAIVPDDASATLSPARSHLADHLAAIARAQADVDRASRPVARLREQVRVASEQLAAADAELAAIDVQHAARIRDAAKSGAAIEVGKPPVREKVEAAVESARRTKAAVERALAECAADLNVATAALRGVEGKGEPLMLAVLLEEHVPTIERWHQARAACIAAEAELLGLQDAIAAHGRDLQAKEAGRGIAWLREWEALRGAWQKEPVREIAPADIQAASNRWIAMLARLATDSAAAV